MGIEVRGQLVLSFLLSGTSDHQALQEAPFPAETSWWPRLGLLGKAFCIGKRSTMVQIRFSVVGQFSSYTYPSLIWAELALGQTQAHWK